MKKKVEQKMIFAKKRDYNLITPCCGKVNKNGAFQHSENFGKKFGYCFSCGKTTAPLPIWVDGNNNEFIWNNELRKFEKRFKSLDIETTSLVPKQQELPVQKFINENEIWKHFYVEPENNLLRYLRKNYGDDKIDEVKEMYAIGTYTDGGTMFWSININNNVQKLKISYYNENGKRTNNFKVPYTNDSGYYSCLFGEHLLIKGCKSQVVILVESEKTAIVGAILFPNHYTWLAYGGLNGLTESKGEVLKGFEKVLIVPDFSENAVNAIQKRIDLLNHQGFNLKIWNLVSGIDDENLKKLGLYNCDLEDIFRNQENPIFNSLL
ncbi:hypothetical protein FJ651_09005 [Paucihalobacter ruber]|uniref:DUF6371 domain-containing protein n=1 Tax=Paucihalobacter ruber TaxID=2567861 RepID=A0A506PI35_9FLAO|nr:DUF6371 domain-containing protein [Paucihalobacter ruber]TPV33224.1 hypothetical protein FJ651_09005 [Paucihalobacter ruber]